MMTAKPKDHNLERRNRASAQGKAVQEQIKAVDEGRFGDAIEHGKDCMVIDRKADGLESAGSIDAGLKVAEQYKGLTWDWQARAWVSDTPTFEGNTEDYR